MDQDSRPGTRPGPAGSDEPHPVDVELDALDRIAYPTALDTVEHPAVHGPDLHADEHDLELARAHGTTR
jgi:hypothetical protein